MAGQWATHVYVLTPAEKGVMDNRRANAHTQISTKYCVDHKSSKLIV